MFEDWVLGFLKFGDVSAWLEVYATSIQMLLVITSIIGSDT